MTSNRNEKIYSVAKKSTLVEAILTFHLIHGFEYYGMSDKKRGFVTLELVIVYLVLCTIFFFSLAFLDLVSWKFIYPKSTGMLHITMNPF